MPRISTSFRVDYTLVEPHDPLWAHAREDARAAMRRSTCARPPGEGPRPGRGQGPARPAARPNTATPASTGVVLGPAESDAPPLTPAHGLSRFRSYLDGRANRDEAEFFWPNNWGRIAHFHRVGAKNRWAKKGRLPVRDVIGISNACLNRVRRGIEAWWKAWRSAGGAEANFRRPRAGPARRGLAVKAIEPAPLTEAQKKDLKDLDRFHVRDWREPQDGRRAHQAGHDQRVELRSRVGSGPSKPRRRP